MQWSPSPSPAPAPKASDNLDPDPKAPSPSPAADWPDDWRTKLAGGDDKVLKRLERYASPLAVRDALFAAQDKIRSGSVKSKLPDNPTEADVKAWRAENGIPETPEGYDTNLGEGHVWGEADKPLLQSFTAAAHAANIPPDAVKPMLKWYEGLAVKQAEARQNADAEFKKANVDELRQEWGADYRMNLRVVDEFFEAMPDELGQVLLNARDAEGRPLGANAAFLRWAAQMQREANPLATVIPGGGQNSMQAMEGEIAKIKVAMADPDSEYFKGPKITKDGRTETKMAWRYYELLQAQERVQGKRQ